MNRIIIVLFDRIKLLVMLFAAMILFVSIYGHLNGDDIDISIALRNIATLSVVTFLYAALSAGRFSLLQDIFQGFWRAEAFLYIISAIPIIIIGAVYSVDLLLTGRNAVSQFAILSQIAIVCEFTFIYVSFRLLFHYSK